MKIAQKQLRRIIQEELQTLDWERGDYDPTYENLESDLRDYFKQHGVSSEDGPLDELIWGGDRLYTRVMNAFDSNEEAERFVQTIWADIQGER